jgi:hypothetical protein
MCLRTHSQERDTYAMICKGRTDNLVDTADGPLVGQNAQQAPPNLRERA